MHDENMSMYITNRNELPNVETTGGQAMDNKNTSMYIFVLNLCVCPGRHGLFSPCRQREINKREKTPVVETFGSRPVVETAVGCSGLE